MPRPVKLITVLLLSLTLGLHWAVLQSVAWTTMVVSRTQEGSFATALQTTFDGRHPCKLCNVVREGKAAEEKSDGVLKELVKLEMLPASGTVAFHLAPPRVRPVPPVSSPAYALDTEAPPLPPPRA